MRERIESLADSLHASATGKRERWAFDDAFHAWWVDADRILAGEYPGSPDPTQRDFKLALLADAGIATIVDLTRDDDHLAPYGAHWESLGESRGRKHKRLHHPIRDLDVTTPERYDAILADIDAELAADRPVYVHCWGGVGRTGTVVGLVHVKRGADAPTALEAISAARQGTRKAHRPAPEMACQVAVIRDAARRWHGDRSGA